MVCKPESRALVAAISDPALRALNTRLLGECRFAQRQTAATTVAFDRPLTVHSPMVVGCPDRLLDRQADDRTDLVAAG